MIFITIIECFLTLWFICAFVIGLVISTLYIADCIKAYCKKVITWAKVKFKK